MIPILPDTAWREFRGQPKQGLNKTTHLAVIQDPAGKLRHCYVKMTPDDWPSPITEAIAYLIAEALDLPRPGFAALLFAPINKLKDCLKLDQHWLRSSHAIAFCCEAVPGRDLNQMWKWIADIRKAKFFRSPEVGQVAAFDLWTANQDRHTGNVIKSGGRYVPIDNEYILYPLLWNNVTFRVQFQTLLAGGLSCERYAARSVDGQPKRASRKGRMPACR